MIQVTATFQALAPLTVTVDSLESADSVIQSMFDMGALTVVTR